MKKLMKWGLTALMLALGVCLTGCSKGKTRVLHTVPADAWMVYYLNAESTMDQLEVKKDGNGYTYCKELKQIVDLVPGADKKIINRALDLVEQTRLSAVMYVTGRDMYLTFEVKDGKDFCNDLKQFAKKNLDEDLDFDEEEGGYVSDDNRCVVYNDQVWISSKKMDVDEAKELQSLKKEDKFTEQAGRHFVDEWDGADVTAGVYLGINNALQTALKLGELSNSEYTEVKGVLSMIFEDAQSVVSVSRMNGDGCEGEVRVLNEDGKDARLVLDMAKVNPAQMNKINNDAPLVAAIGVSNKLTTMIADKVDGFLGAREADPDSEDEQTLALLRNIDGTVAFSMNALDECILSANFKDADQAEALAKYWLPATLTGTGRSGYAFSGDVSMAGSMVVARSVAGLKGGGSPASEFKDAYAALVIDGRKAKEMVQGYDCSKLGRMSLVLAPKDGGVVLRFKMELKNPLRTLLGEVLKLAMALQTGEVSVKGADAEPPFKWQSKYDEMYDVAAVDPWESDPWATDSIAW